MKTKKARQKNYTEKRSTRYMKGLWLEKECGGCSKRQRCMEANSSDRAGR